MVQLAGTINETMSLPREATALVCPENSSAHPPFLRADLAYSIFGIDCFGERVQMPGRTPAGEKKDLSCDIRTYSHARFLRPDIAYGVLGIDCQGDPPR